MKTRFVSLALCLALLAGTAALASCGEEAPAPAANDTAAATEAVTEAAPVETEAVTEAVTQPPARDHFDEIQLSTKEGNRNPMSVLTKNSDLATRFKVDEGFIEEITVSCPSWSDNVGSLTFKLYRWDTDYETTIAKDPLYSETFVDYDDNSDLTLTCKTDSSRGAEAGEYLLFVGDGVDEGGSGVGIWSYGFPTEDDRVIECYRGGKSVKNFGMDGNVSIVIPAK